MAGKPKQGIVYSGWSTSMFDNDEKIDQLLDTHGWIGFGVYFYLCQRICGGDGYYCKWSYASCPTIARKMGGGIGSNTVKEVVGHCLRIGLFNQGLFDRWGILTSRGIQRSFWRVLSARRVKTVYSEYWLLDDEECQGLNKVTLNGDLPVANDDLPPANDHKNRTVQNSTVQYRTEQKTAPDEPAAAPGGESVLSKELLHFYSAKIEEVTTHLRGVLADIVKEYGEEWVKAAIDVAVKSNHRNMGYVKGILKNWKTEGKGPKKISFLNYEQRSDTDWDAWERESNELTRRPYE